MGCKCISHHGLYGNDIGASLVVSRVVVWFVKLVLTLLQVTRKLLFEG